MLWEPVLSAIWRHNKNLAICKPGRELVPKFDHVDTLTLDFQLKESWESKFPLFKAHSLWYFVMVVWTNIYFKTFYFSQGVYQFSSVTQLCPTLQSHESQHARPPCPSPTPGVHPNRCLLSQWCHPAISSSVIPFCSCPQSFPAKESIIYFKFIKKHFSESVK